MLLKRISLTILSPINTSIISIILTFKSKFMCLQKVSCALFWKLDTKYIIKTFFFFFKKKNAGNLHTANNFNSREINNLTLSVDQNRVNILLWKSSMVSHIHFIFLAYNLKISILLKVNDKINVIC